MLHVALLSLALAADAPKDQKAEAAQQKIQVAGYFDIAACGLNRPAVPDTVNKEVLQGLIQYARPLVLECLTDAKTRGAEQQTVVTLDVALTDTGAKTTVGGKNLTPAGTACVQKAVDDWTRSFPQLTATHAKAKDVSAHAEFAHVAGVQPSAKMGLNEASDFFSALRLAQPTWCDCYADSLKGPVAAELKGTMKLKKPEKPADVSPTDLVLKPTDPAGDKLAECVKGKLAALKVKAPTEPELDLPVQVQELNSNFSGKLPGAPPPLQFGQYDLAGNQLIAQMLIDDGARAMAFDRYQELAIAYNEHKKGMKLEAVGEACTGLLKADDAVVGDNQKLFAQAKEVHDFTVELKAKDPNWAAAEAATAKRVPAIESQLQKVQKLADDDKSRCAKVTAAEAEPTSTKPAKKKGKK